MMFFTLLQAMPVPPPRRARRLTFHFQPYCATHRGESVPSP